MSSGVASENMKPFDTNLKPTMSNLVNGRVILKINNSGLVQKGFSSLHSTLFSIYIKFMI